ncbi:MAG: hypothetical protein IKE25_01565, partial [Clostridia bacterium]|nr:hypothetical protein [Clostridia bacterium]
AEEETCTYTIFNETGEKITELYVTDNTTGEKSDNYAGEEGLDKGAIIEINGTNKEGYVITLSFKTESGYEGAFETLHFETVPITLFSQQTVADNKAAAGADATSGATPISFFAPVCTYTVYNTTGEKITELYVTDNATGEKSENFAGEGMADGASVEIKGTNKADYVVTLSFRTESGYEGTFSTLHFETVPISLLVVDAASGATSISFKAPEGK